MLSGFCVRVILEMIRISNAIPCVWMVYCGTTKYGEINQQDITSAYKKNLLFIVHSRFIEYISWKW